MWSGKNTPPTPFKFLPSQTPPRPPLHRYGTRASFVHIDLLVGWWCFIHRLAGTILVSLSSIPGLVSANWSNVPRWTSSTCLIAAIDPLKRVLPNQLARTVLANPDKRTVIQS